MEVRDQINEVMPTATHVGVQVDLVTAGDECVIGFRAEGATYQTANQTADYIS